MPYVGAVPIKTSVYLPAELKAELALLAGETGESEATLIREAVADLVERRRLGRRPTLPLFTSGRPGIARVADALVRSGDA